MFKILKRIEELEERAKSLEIALEKEKKASEKMNSELFEIKHPNGVVVNEMQHFGFNIEYNTWYKYSNGYEVKFLLLGTEYSGFLWKEASVTRLDKVSYVSVQNEDRGIVKNFIIDINKGQKIDVVSFDGIKQKKYKKI